MLILILSVQFCHVLADPPHMESAIAKVRQTFSKHLGISLVSSPGVPSPNQSEYLLLPYLSARSSVFKGARVLDVATGNGVLALFAAKHGAASVVATDINPRAIADTQTNARRLNVSHKVDARLVTGSDLSAFAAMHRGETFDIILANPPYTIDLDKKNSNFTDGGILGPSLIKGLKERLSPDGVAILLYRNLFYHLYLAKLARQLGLYVKSFPPNQVSPRELEILFNSYAGKLDNALGHSHRIVFKSEHDDLGQLRVIAEPPLGGTTKFHGILVISPNQSKLQ